MKVIDLLVKIANGEEVPKKIYCFNREFYLKGNTYFGDTFTLMHYIQEEDLNDEVEILEEDKEIEKIDLSEWAEITYREDWEMLTKDFNRNCSLFVDKINEIIDYLEENK